MLAACDVPRWAATAEPETATLFVDSRARPRPRVVGPVPYYGTVDLAAVPAPGATGALRTARATLTIEEPVTPWIFPLDFVVESLEALFVEHPVPTARLVLTAREDVPTPEVEPPGLEAFVERGRGAATAR